MDTWPYAAAAEPSGLRLLLDHFSRIEDKRSPESVAHKLDEVLLVCVCATIAECDSFDAISDWGQAHLEFVRRWRRRLRSPARAQGVRAWRGPTSEYRGAGARPPR